MEVISIYARLDGARQCPYLRPPVTEESSGTDLFRRRGQTTRSGDRSAYAAGIGLLIIRLGGISETP